MAAETEQEARRILARITFFLPDVSHRGRTS
ncbi:hypothetical protein QT319_04425 [Escherichia coli]|nr:hypothetical protein [Escherichia coli]